MSKERSKLDKKYSILTDRLRKESPEIKDERDAFFLEIEKMWKEISPFVGEEEAYAKLSLRLNEDFEIRAYPLDYILWFVLFKRLDDKLDRELKWFKDNREILEIMVKEYLKAQDLR